jgi:phosphoglycerate dehydrogenase-like enzyme
MASAIRIVVPDDDPAALRGTNVEDRLRRLGDLVIYDSLAPDPSDLAVRLKDARVTINIRSSSLFTAEVLSACPGLKHIVVLGVGVDNVDLVACREKGILVTNTPGHSTDAVAEHAIALALAVARRLNENDRAVREGEWARHPIVQLSGKTLGVIGAGPIGMRMAALGRGLGMKVVAWTFNPTDERAKAMGAPFLALDELMTISDVVSLHLPISDKSRGLIDINTLSLMKPDAILVNTARGAIVDESALAQALQRDQIGGAGLDAYMTEPLPLGHELGRLNNVILSPHNAAMTMEAGIRGLEMVAENIEAWLEGNPTNIIV